ncbi:TolC family protein [Parachitinimonas caeni]|uniref:TolC family protein n=1 Tax=Parachitinimonas caeni TaxID=3031301 RepID=A0ABT7DXG3_9NEIS|nr:TolC family protein [Parachitinimonas caeni]MDK2124753.1 TolC family protein [Parachitinimonas caeni]
MIRRILISLLVVGISPAPALTLQQLEALAREAAPEQRLAALEAEALQHRLDAAQAQGNARLVGGASLADTRESVSETEIRDYRRSNLQLGVRWSLLAAAREREQASNTARTALQQARLNEQEVLQTVLRQLRRAYAEVWHIGERVRLSHQFLQSETVAQGWLRLRMREHLLLESDRLSFQSMFDLARRELVRHEAAQADALGVLQRLTGQSLQPFVAQPLGLQHECVSLEQLRAEISQRPAVAQAQAEVALRQQRVQEAKASGMDAGVSLVQSLSRDIGGPSGRSTGVTVDFTLPLGDGPVRQARRAAASAELQRAQLLLDTRLADLQRELTQTHATLTVRLRDMVSSRTQLDAAQEAWRIAELRTHSLYGDVLERELQTRYALYQAAMDYSRARQRQDEAVIDWLALAPADVKCPAATGLPPLPDTLFVALAKAVSLQPAPQTSSLAPQQTVATTASLGFFDWNGRAWLQRTAPWSALPPGTGRLSLSFTAEQVKRMAEPKNAWVVRQMLNNARQRGIRVEWLLGDPEWVQPAGRPALLALLRQLSGFQFDAVNLDLERSQLPDAAQADWAEQVIDTLHEVRQTVSWPVVLTTHHREFADKVWVQRLLDAGLSQGVAMIYVSDPERVVEIAQPLLQGPLPLAIAQSVESALPGTESSATQGRRLALTQWQRLAGQLSNQSGFLGVTVQSWKHFQEAKP